MGKLTPVTIQQRLDQTAQVILSRDTEGLTVEEACQKIGISLRQFYKWLPQAEARVEILRQSANSLYYEELAQILVSKSIVLGRVIEAGLSQFTEPADRLAILSYLDNRLEVLQEKTTPIDSEGLKEILGPPALKEGESRFSGSPYLDVATAPDGSVTITPRLGDVIDITPEETD